MSSRQINITSYEYDGVDLIRSTDPNGNVTAYAYDKGGRLVSKTDALGNATTYTYDPNGNLLTITDALGGVTSYAYDALNRVVSITDTDGTETRYEYDALGNVVTEAGDDALAAPEPGERRGMPAYEPETLSARANTRYKPAFLAAQKGSFLGGIRDGLKNLGNTLKSWGKTIANTVSKAFNAVKNVFTGGGGSQPQSTAAPKATPTPKATAAPTPAPTPTPTPQVRSAVGSGGGSKPTPVTQSPVNPSWSPTTAQAAYTTRPEVSGRDDSYSCSNRRTENGGITLSNMTSYIRSNSKGCVTVDYNFESKADAKAFINQTFLRLCPPIFHPLNRQSKI